jgi:GDP-fucose protein O-fucosyltransferase
MLPVYNASVRRRHCRRVKYSLFLLARRFFLISVFTTLIVCFKLRSSFLFPHSLTFTAWNLFQASKIGPEALGADAIQVEDARSHLKTLCNKTTWIDGLWLRCDSHYRPNQDFMCGGFNARNRLQSCIRLAIDAGANLIIPKVATLSEASPKSTNNEAVDPSLFWDMGYLKRSLHKQCPHLQLRYNSDTSWVEKNMQVPKYGHRDLGFKIGEFREFTQNVFSANNITSISPSNPLVLSWGDSEPTWNYTESREDSTISKDLYRILRFNRSLLAIGDRVLSKIDRNTLLVGIHYPWEANRRDQFTTPTQVMQRYTSELLRLHSFQPKAITQVYISSTNRSATQDLRTQLEPYGFAVHDKHSLLASEPSLLAELDALSHHQRAIVDYAALVSADYFLGAAASSLAALVAYARTLHRKDRFFTDFAVPDPICEPVTGRSRDAPPVRGNERTWLFVP